MATTKDHSSNDGRLRVGVLVLPPVQLLDLSPIDLFSMMTPEYLAACQLPAPLIALGIPVQIEYIASSGSKSLAELTANLKIAITASLTDPAVAPGKLDILLIPGPDPGRSTAEEEKVFIRGHTEKAKAVMTVCTGVFPAADSGILDGKSVTAPRALIPMLKERYKDVKWVEKRWATDGNIWTSGKLVLRSEPRIGPRNAFTK